MTTPPNRSRPATRALAVATVTALTAASVLASTVPAAAETDTTTTVVEESLSASSTARTSSTPTTWTYRDTRTAPFTTLGVSWRAGTTVQPSIQFRTRADGVWSAWTAAPETAATPAEAERAGTDPVYVGEADGVEVRMTTPRGTTVADPSVTLIDPGEAPTPAATAAPRTTTMSTRAAAPYLPPKPAVVSRAQWGADESWRCRTPSYTSTIQAAIVHHTAGANGYTKAESAGIVRGIYAYHTKTLGWCDLGYNVLVDKYGTVFEGRAGGLDRPVLGAHATSWNSGTTGVSLMGNFETAAAPAVMMESAAKVIAWKLAPYGRDPKSRVTLAGKTIFRIAGHGDVMSTACPGVNVRSKLPALRDRVAALMKAPAAAAPSPAPAPATTAIGQRWQALGGGSGVLGWPLKPEAVVADGTWREFRNHDLFASPRTAAFWTTGAVRTHYRSLKTATSALGFPTSDEKNVSGVTGARMNSFEKGWIVWSPGNGTHAITGAIFTSYSKDAALRGRLGAPTGARTTSEFGVASQTFRGGRLFEVGGAVVALEGAAYRHFAARSTTQRASIGAPTGNAVAVTAGVTKTRATVQRMQKGTYVTVGSKAILVKGSLHSSWREFGAEKSRLGLPTADEKTVSGGWTQTFERGTISRINGETTIRFR